MNTPIQALYLYLENTGVLSSWTGPDGEIQDTPVVQTRLLKESDAKKSQRIFLIKNSSGGSGNRFVSMPVFTFAVMGKPGEDSVFAETYANLIYDILLDFDFADCVIGIDPIGGVNGPYLTESSRPVYDMEFMVKVDSGRV